MNKAQTVSIGPPLGGWIITEQKEIGVDSLSIIFSSFGWGGLLYGFSMVGSVGWTDRSVVLALFIGTVSLVIFIRRQLQQEKPMLNFGVFSYREFTLTTILGVLMFTTMIGVQIVLPLYVQQIKGASAFISGVMLLPGAIVTGVMSPIAGRLFDRFGARGLAILGFSFMFLSALLYFTIDMESSISFIAVIFSIMMLGISLLMTPLMTAGINALPFQLIAHGAAMNNTIRMVGGSIGTAIIMSVYSTISKASKALDPALIMLEGIRAAFMVVAVIVLIGLTISFFLTKKAKQVKPSS